MDPFTFVMLAITAASAVAKGVSQYESSNDQKQQLNAESELRQLQYQQKTLANFELTNKMLDTQLAQASTRGVSLASPSFEAIQRQTANVSAKRQSNLTTEEDIFENNIAIEKQNVNDTLYAQLFGDVAETGVAFAGIKAKMGSKG